MTHTKHSPFDENPKWVCHKLCSHLQHLRRQSSADKDHLHRSSTGRCTYTHTHHTQQPSLFYKHGNANASQYVHMYVRTYTHMHWVVVHRTIPASQTYVHILIDTCTQTHTHARTHVHTYTLVCCNGTLVHVYVHKYTCMTTGHAHLCVRREVAVHIVDLLLEALIQHLICLVQD